MASSSGDAGALEFTAIKSLLTSNLALGIGVLVAAYGVYLMLVKQNSKAGFTLLIASALIALTPGLLDGLRAQLCPAIENMGGSCGNTKAYGGTVTATTSAQMPTDSMGKAALTSSAQMPAAKDVQIVDGKAVVMPDETLSPESNDTFVPTPDNGIPTMPNVGRGKCQGNSYLGGVICVE